TPMGLACQSLLVRDDGGGVRHPFQYGGAGPTSAPELKHRISGIVSKADHALLRKDSIDFGCGLADRRRRVVRPSRPWQNRPCPIRCLASPALITGPALMFCANPETRPRTDTAAGSSLKQVAFAFLMVAPFRKQKSLAMPTQKKNLRLGWAGRLCS